MAEALGLAVSVEWGIPKMAKNLTTAIRPVQHREK